MYSWRFLRRSLIVAATATALPFAAANGAPASGKGLLGVAVANPSPPAQGALIARLLPEGSAARAGLRLQDLIMQADSQAILSASDLTAYVATRRAGDRITLTVMRPNGASLGRVQVTATLDPAPISDNLAGASSPQNGPPPTHASAPAGAPPRGLTHVSWTTFTDPYENAFSIEVPQGWRVAGGVIRKTPLWPAMVLRVLSPERRTLLAVGDPDSVPYSAPIAARDYVRRFTESAMSPACSGLKIVAVADLPDVERFASSNSLGPYNQWSAAQATFTCNGDRQTGMAGQAIAVLQYMTTLRSGHAQILAAFVTTTGQENAADELLNHMIATLRQNPEWSARQQQMAQQLANGAMARWQGEQRQFQQMDDAITNTAHFVAPDGRRYDLDARPRYQWLAPDGKTVGTDTPTPPSPGSQALQRLGE
ncbi:MAG TPA: PDZ domain-containing protein [Steroidobacteraceae bacterium]|nr:PDZ domain-containing protein [Steroidobacteraceae bacterium]